MFTQPRFEAECEVIARHFPSFEPFVVPGVEAGFWGYLTGPRSGTTYEVTSRARIRDYPQCEPRVYMCPHAEAHHWYPDNRLCYRREERKWNPAEDTFAQTIAMAIKYIAEFDGS